MLTIAKEAEEKFKEILKAQNVEHFGVRVSILGRAIDSFAYDFALWDPERTKPEDTVIDAGDVKVSIAADSVDLLNDATIQFDIEKNGFYIDNPARVWDNSVGPRVAKVIIEQINPDLASHQGGVILVDIKDNIAYVRMMGGCQGCGMANVTLTEGIEQTIKQAVPEITGVKDVTHHAAGENPYYPSET